MAQQTRYCSFPHKDLSEIPMGHSKKDAKYTVYRKKIATFDK